MQTVRVVILAAGKGKRMGASDRPKVLHSVLGRPMLAYVLDAVVESGVDAKPVVIVGHMAEHVKAVCGAACEYVHQEEQKGTGDAVRSAQPLLENASDNVMVLVGDQPFVSARTIRKVADMHLASGATLTMGTVTVPDFEDWRAAFVDSGRVERDAAGKLIGIVEAKDADERQKSLREINPSYYCFKAAWLWKNLIFLKNDNAKGEYYLTDLPARAMREGAQVMTVPISPEEALGVNTPEHLQTAEKMMQSCQSGK